MPLSRHPLAQDLIKEALREVSPTRFELLLEIIDIEEVHLTDKSSVAPQQVAAAIERAAKMEGEAEASS